MPQLESTDQAVHIAHHPLIDHSLSIIRDASTTTEVFRRNARAITVMLAFHVFEHLSLEETRVTTPLEETVGYRLDTNIIFVPVLRAGLAMLDAMSDIVPQGKVGFVGLERDETTAIARSYYQKLPSHLHDAEAIILDPMLATGGSAITTIRLLKEQHATKISLACIVAAPEGIAAVRAAHPDVEINLAAVDRELNDKKYILPGLGDFGDRYFGTTD